MHKERGRRRLLWIVVSCLATYAMVFSAVPTWAIAENMADSSNGVNGGQGLVDNNAASNTDAGQKNDSTNGQDSNSNATQNQTANNNGSQSGSTGEETPEEAVAPNKNTDANASDTSSLKSTSEDVKSDTEDLTELASGKDEEASSELASETDAKVSAEVSTNQAPHVEYTAHVQRKAWLPTVKDGAVGGTVGERLRLEGIRIKLNLANTGLTGGIQYRAHVQRRGWMDWTNGDNTAGVIGQSLRMEALRIRLTGEVANAYDVYYCAHVQGKGWMAWAKNGDAAAGTTGQGLRVEAIKVVLVKKGDKAPDSSFVNYNKPFVGEYFVAMEGHSQRVGWGSAVGNGGVVGTTGRSLRLEAIRVNTLGWDVSGGIELDGHVQGIGWMGYRNGYTGTTGQGKRLEAVRMRLTGDAIRTYDIYYRVHVAHIGWLDWTYNGRDAGTSGMAARAEAVQYKIVPKNTPGPSSSDCATPGEAFISGTNVGYTPYCQSYSWRPEVWNGGVAGTTGQNKRLETIKMRLSGGTIGGGIVYNSFVSGSGWQGNRSNGADSGTIGQARGIEGIRISLTGRAAKMYDVYYRTHVAKAGWLGWACNGQAAGAPNTGKSIQAVCVQLVPKGNPAPGSTANYAVDRSFFDDPMIKAAQGYSSPTGWLVMVDTDRTLLGVFRGSRGNWSKYDMWRISCGAPSKPSRRGVHSVSGRGYVFGDGYSCYWWVSWSGPYLFHSIKYYPGTFDVMDGRIGEHISAGCVRMPIERAKWIYDNIPDGTTVVVY